MRYLLESVEVLYIINWFYAWAESSMHAKHFIFYDACYGQVVKHIGEVLPGRSVPKLLLALHVEAVVLSDTSSFVISSYESDSIRISDF